MKWIQRILGLTELIKHQKETNELLVKLIDIQKVNTNNQSTVFSSMKKVY